MARGSATRLLSGSGTTGREPLAGRADVLAPLVLLGGAGADHGRAGKRLRARLGTPFRVQGAGRQAAAPDVAQYAPAGAGGRDRLLAAEPRERERALRVDLADPRRGDLRALGEG